MGSTARKRKDEQKRYPCSVNSVFEDITYTLILKRKPMYYLWNLVLSCIALLCIGIVVHLLDAKGERLQVSITTLPSLSFC